MTQPHQHHWAYFLLTLFILRAITEPHALHAKTLANVLENLPTKSWEKKLKKRFPVAIISGKFEAYDSDKNNIPVALDLEVTDQLSRVKQKLVYHPLLHKGGEYKMFLRPNRTYEICIIPLKKGYKKHKTQIYIPRSTYSYEFNRKLRLETLKSESGKTIATKISVIESSHRFIDTKEVSKNSAYDGIIEMVSTTFSRADSINLEHLIYSTYIPDTVSYQMEVKNTKTSRRYDELIHTAERAMNSGSMTPMDSLIEISELLNDAYVSQEHLKESRKIKSESFYFDRNSASIAPKYAARLKELTQIFKNRTKKLVLKINGYSDLDGLAEKNEILATRRALSILVALKKYQVDKSGFILILNGFGAVHTENPEEARRADVHIYKLED